MTKRARIWGFQTVKIAPRHSIWPKNACVMAKWHFRLPNFLASDIRPTDFLFFGGHIFRQFKSRPMPPELPGSVAGVYKWLLTPGRSWQMAVFGAFWGVLWLKNR
jgi:hypothetical protein